MPEYLAPGVYVEETSFRSKSIEGVSTTTTGFVGFCRYGPVDYDLPPEVVTSLTEFEQIYGDRQKLKFGTADDEMDNYLWHAARAFFSEGGKRLYVARVFKPEAGDLKQGRAEKKLLLASPPIPDANNIIIKARFPGAAGNMRIRLIVRMSQNILSIVNGKPRFAGLRDYDIVWVNDVNPPSPPAIEKGSLYTAKLEYKAATDEFVWKFTGAGGLSSPVSGDLVFSANDKVRIVTLAVGVTYSDGTEVVWDGLAPDPRHTINGEPDGINQYFAEKPANAGLARSLPIVIQYGSNLDTGLEIMKALMDSKKSTSPIESKDLETALDNDESSEADRTVSLVLEGGNDGERPEAGEYEGTASLSTNLKTGLKVLEDLEDISIVAAPGYSFGYEGIYNSNANTIANLLIIHATQMRYRIAILDSGNGQTISQVRAMKGRFDSKYAALYYPWVTVLDPVTRREIQLPPSGFVAGIYARNDINRAVYKAPANEVVNLAIGFEKLLNKSQQDILNPEHINCFRFFEGRGFLLWGARTISSDPEWKYVNLRRYFAYLERSIDKGTQWAVFEPNGPQLWDNVRRTIEDFLLNEWQMGALLGEKPEKAYFVKCDRSTMTQNDLDNGRLVCLIGIAPVRPAEFVIFRIGQWTGDRKV
jgi:uncharacterized protein